MSQEKKSRKSSSRNVESTTSEATRQVPVAKNQATEVDDLLNEIDSVLEQNAEEFVSSFVQKGGE